MTFMKFFKVCARQKICQDIKAVWRRNGLMCKLVFFLQLLHMKSKTQWKVDLFHLSYCFCSKQEPFGNYFEALDAYSAILPYLYWFKWIIISPIVKKSNFKIWAESLKINSSPTISSLLKRKEKRKKLND